MRTWTIIPLSLAILAAGCVGAPDELDAASAELASEAEAAAALREAFAFDGRFGGGVIVCPMVTCEGFSLGETAKEFHHELPVTGADLTMTWDAATPAMETLRLGIMWDPEDPGYEYVDGTSPLTLSVDGLGIDAEDEVWIFAWVVSPAPMSLAMAHTPQDFHIEGELTLAEPAQP